MEVWIEILTANDILDVLNVTSLVEVWIEIMNVYQRYIQEYRHFPCGSVD